MSNVKLAIALVLVLWVANVNAQQKAPGSDRNKHGCIGSAGYTYSVVRNDCVRLFEEKIRLKEKTPKGSYTSDAVVIFDKSRQRAEIFLPGSNGSSILKKTKVKGTTVWKAGALVLATQGNGYTLKKSGKLIYVM
ncbi:hypothetical protein VRU48_05655 [Pedobacter sp. KR3-3]|uniref:C-type lysozyme inhibitor domain-containing protein n=1 Tax=Pedobacter albus TaxID=3113905 RepID=A0ABU7I557_9SPHI|nr:hypothetical protein [Pedobacter sp. KR3-3]MEE1944583.1 hypothetical protein [Pedobacter sp. KR3-3]